MRRVLFGDIENGTLFKRENMDSLNYFKKIPESRDKYGFYNAYQLSNVANTVYIDPGTYVIVESSEKDK